MVINARGGFFVKNRVEPNVTVVIGGTINGTGGNHPGVNFLSVREYRTTPLAAWHSVYRQAVFLGPADYRRDIPAEVVGDAFPLIQPFTGNDYLWHVTPTTPEVLEGERSKESEVVKFARAEKYLFLPIPAYCKS
jgi:hypothetical protein